MTIAETDTELTSSNGHTNGAHINTEPIDISWEEVGPKEEPEKPVESSSWEEVDRRVRGRISDAMTLAENHFASTALGRLDALAAIPAFTRTFSSTGAWATSCCNDCSQSRYC